MKILFIALILFAFTSLLMAQQIRNERLIKQNDGQTMVRSTRRGEGGSIQNTLIPGHQTHRIRLHDTENNSNFSVRFYLKEFQSDSVRTEIIGFHPSSRSIYINEMIIGLKSNNWLSIIMQIPGLRSYHFVFPKENERLKWIFFPETPFAKNVPIALIYSESPNDDTLETRFNELFASECFRSLNDKKEIIKRIKAITEHFHFLFYDIVQK